MSVYNKLFTFYLAYVLKLREIYFNAIIIEVTYK